MTHISIGKIVRLQLQRSALTLGQRPHRYYDPSALQEAPQLTLSPGGVSASLPNGLLMDVHHSAHPDSLNDGGENGISVNFTWHYDAMRQRFGAHLWDGCGGENILIACHEQLTQARLAGGMVVQTADGKLIRLKQIVVAHPCNPFSRYVSGGNGEPDDVKRALQFLDHGMRGFYCAVEEPGMISVGDEVLLPG